MYKARNFARRDPDGLAIIGRTKRDLMGIRFADGDETGTDTSDTTDVTDTTVVDALNGDETVNQLAGATARIAELEAELETLRTTLTKVQAHNYQLLTDSPAGTTDTTADNSVLADDDVIDIDDLFE